MADTVTAAAGAMERPEDAGRAPQGEVARWCMELELADKVEKDWRGRAEKNVERYRNGAVSDRSRARFNILYTNVQTMSAALYSDTPRPDVRRRYYDEDPVARVAAEVIERACSYQIDQANIDATIGACIDDGLITGRGVLRLRYEAEMVPTAPGQEEAETPESEAAEADGVSPDPIEAEASDDQPPSEVIADQRVWFELVQWDDFRRGSGRQWSDVQWVAFRHLFTRDEAIDEFGQVAEGVTLDWAPKGYEKRESRDNEESLFKRMTVWEIWDACKRRIIWIAPSFKDRPLRESDDVLRLRAFFPIPMPFYANAPVGELVPVDDYSQYAAQAEELDRLTTRIGKLINGIKLRGIYDASIEEFQLLLGPSSTDNDLVASKGVTAAMQAGGLDRAVWMLPIDMAVAVLAQLVQQRELTKQVIFEISGISDILRGNASGPLKTATEQSIKAQWGSLRLQRRQRDVQRLARDLVRLMAEVIAEHFDPMVLTQMTGRQVTPEVMQLLRSDAMRRFRVDIETNSTIAADEQAERDGLTELMAAITSMGQGLPAAVQSGFISADAAKALAGAVVRRARLGRIVEDAIDGDANRPQQPQQPDPAAQAEQAKAQREQMQAQAEQAKAQAELQRIQMQAQADQQRYQMKLREMQVEHEMKMAELRATAQTKAIERALEPSPPPPAPPIDVVAA